MATGLNGLILFEDEHLLVINKPSGINTHRPDVHAPDGIHEWLNRRYGGELAILHRLDKDTSGVIVFGKTRAANQSLAKQFERHTLRKEYLLLSALKPKRTKCHARSPNTETEFEYLEPHAGAFLVAARPVTGKTHQIRLHAQECGFPILGDTEYGGDPAPRLMLHAHRLTIAHPVSGDWMTFTAPVPAGFDEMNALTAAREYRELLFGGTDTDCYRLVSAGGDGLPELIVDWFAGQALVQWQTGAEIAGVYERLGADVVYAQTVLKGKRTEARLVRGEAGECVAREHGLRYRIRFDEGLSAGLFLDQRENRWRLLRMPLAGKSMLNCFAYTCAFSVAAAQAGARTTSVDLSRNYLEWGKENFALNSLPVEGHDFVAGDVFEWLKRFAKRAQRWDVVLLDPPTFSTTKKGRAFQAERDYGELVQLAAPLVAPGGWLFCSTNQRTFKAEEFERVVRGSVAAVGRQISDREFVTQPFDFRFAKGDQAYLKTLWARLAE